MFIITTVPFFNIYSVLTVPALSSFLTALYAYRLTGNFFIFNIKKKALINILKVSLPLSAATLCFGVFRYTERALTIGYLDRNSLGLFGFAETIVGVFITILIGSVMKVRGLTIFELLAEKKYLKAHNMVVRETLILIMISFLFVLSIYFLTTFLIPIYLIKWISAIEITILFSFVLPIKIIGSYINFVFKSTAVNKLKFEPILHLVTTAFLLLLFYYLKLTNQLTLYNFIVIDLLAYGFYQICNIIYYYKSFYLHYVKKNYLIN